MRKHAAAPLAVTVASGFWGRFRGLMLHPGLAPDQAVLLADCASVHTCFMRFALDVVYLDREGTVVRLVPRLRPWRFSAGGKGAAHVLELAAGGIARFGIRAGERLEECLRRRPASAGAGSESMKRPRRAAAQTRQRGATMIEFAVVGPIITLLGLTVLQYGMLFFAKNQINHAAFMAARAGSMGHAKLDTVQQAYLKALIPLYGGGRNESELAGAYAKAIADTAGNVEIKLLNPTKESFDDWSDPALQQKYGARAIPNSGLSFKNQNEIKNNSGQNIQDANLIKLRITHGYAPKVPLVGTIYTKYLQWLDSGTDSFHTRLVNAGRIPIVTHVTLQMHSDPVEDVTVSTPGMGNNGNPGDPADPADPGDPPSGAADPPDCVTVGCTVQDTPPGNTPIDPGGGNNGAGQCLAVSAGDLSADVLFAFGQSTLTAPGQSQLDQLIAAARNQTFNSLTLTGYTDQLANPGFDNNQLSLERAQAVRDYLQAHGFPGKPIQVQGLGAQHPIKQLADCPAGGPAQIACLAPNRRVNYQFN